MMLALRIGSVVVMGLLLAAVDAEAQGRGRGSRTGNAAATVSGKANGNGPAFCRSGEGHPVHGWEWCRQKGWNRPGRTSRVVVDRNGRVIDRTGGIIVPDARDGDIAIPRRVPRRDDDDDDDRDGGWWPF